MRVTLIAAVARNRVIGREGEIPWHLPADLARFKRRTWGQPLVMGRKTYQAIGHPLPGRTTVVVTRQEANLRDPSLPAGSPAASPGDGPEQNGEMRVAASPEEALALAVHLARWAGRDEVFVAGGGEIYRRFLPYAHRLDLTEVDLEPEGDVTFPPFDEEAWREVKREEHGADERNPHRYRFRVLERKGRPPRSLRGKAVPEENPGAEAGA